MLLHDGDQVRPLLRPGLRPETMRSADGRRLIEIIPRADRGYAVVLRCAATGQIITDQLPRTARQMITLVRAWAADGPGSSGLVAAEEDLDLSGANMPQDITDPTTGGSRLLSERCATCILAAGDRMHLGPERLQAFIADALAAGTFVVCHDTLTYGNYPDYGPAICRGFYDAYAGRSPALSLLRACQRLVEVSPPQAALPDAIPPGTGTRTLPGMTDRHS
jgi:guanyl-specific ribonuclease Sa